MYGLMFLYTDQKRYEEAAELGDDVVRVRKELWGEKNLDTMKEANGLALLYANQGRHEEAERLQLRLQEISSESLGGENSITLLYLGHLAITHNS
jgi:tetratricopeptide (TPR) repeat protein